MAISAKWSDFSSLDGARAAALASNRLPPLVCLLLVLVLGWQLAKIAWLLVPGTEAGDPVLIGPPAGTPLTTNGRSSSADVDQVAAAHLFGEARAEDEIILAAPESTENLQETRLALTLTGTMAGTDNVYTRAIIADNRNEEKIYTIGDVVTAGAKLHAVYPDRVVLNRSGVLEALNLPKDLPAGSPPPRSRSTATRTASRSEPRDESLQQAISQNAARLADVIRPTPYFVGGQQQGYRVYPGRDRRQFAALGLRPGDLIKEIDGQALTDQQQALQIFQSLGTSDQVSVTVERNGQPQVLVLTTNQIESGPATE